VPGVPGNNPPPELLLRFADLKRMKLISTFAALKRKIDNEGFPPGRWIGPNTRAWLASEGMEWIKSRPASRPDTPAIKAWRKVQQQKRSARATSQAEAR